MSRHGIVAATARSQPVPEAKFGAKCKPTIIEMFGVPGAGKTTLAAAVIQDGCQRTRKELTAAWNRLSRLQKSAFLLRALTDARCVGAAAAFALRIRLTSSDSLVRLVRIVAKTRWMRSQSGVLLLDESFLQEVWSVCISAGMSDPDQVALARLIRCLYADLAAHIVFLEADEVIASRRISGRSHGNSRLDGLTIAEAETCLSRSARLPYAIIAAATAAGLPVERLDGADPVEANTDRLRKLLIARSCEQVSD